MIFGVKYDVFYYYIISKAKSEFPRALPRSLVTLVSFLHFDSPPIPENLPTLYLAVSDKLPPFKMFRMTNTFYHHFQPK
jgi:hypothetical protein